MGDRRSDVELLQHFKEAVRLEREALERELSCLGEIERRKLFLAEGFPSLYSLLVRGHNFSEYEAVMRTKSARAATRYPEILSYVREGRISLPVLGTVAELLKPDNYLSVLERCVGKTRDEAQVIAAELAPRPAVGELIRLMSSAAASCAGPLAPAPPPEQQSASVPSSSAPPQTQPAQFRREITPTAPRRYLFRFVGDEEFRIWVRRLRDLESHRVRSGEVADLLKLPVREYLENHDPLFKLQPAARRASDPRSRRPPLWVKEEVMKRDQGRCTWSSSEGVRCAETRWLEYDHIVPWSLGGRSDDPANLRLLCGPHNRLEAERRFGPPPRRPAED